MKVAEKFNSELKEICAERELSQKEKLAFLGIYSRPELYELAGEFAAETRVDKTDFTSFASTGIALPSTAMDDIITIDMKDTEEVVFIENKTNYDEYLLNEKFSKQLVVFHGGFVSPQKRKLIQKLAAAASGNGRFYFWGDIDLGGFQMFYRLKALIPSLQPMRMSENEVNQSSGTGLKQSEEYLKRLESALKNNEFPDFCKAIERILFYGATIEQKIFLTQIEK